MGEILPHLQHLKYILGPAQGMVFPERSPRVREWLGSWWETEPLSSESKREGTEGLVMCSDILTKVLARPGKYSMSFEWA